MRSASDVQRADGGAPRGGAGRLWRRRADLPLLAEAACRLAVAALILKLQPFRRVARRLLRPAAVAAPADPTLLPPRVRWAVRAAARRVPWRSVCFDQAIAAQAMLGRRGIAAELVYGVRRSSIGLDAHVWVRLADGGDLLGGGQAASFRPIALFRPGQGEVLPPPGA